MNLANHDRITIDVEVLRKGLEPHISEMERACCLPPSVVKTLRDIGIFRILAPKQFGGNEVEFPAALELIRRIATIDGSIAWVAAINSAICLMLPKLPLASLETVYRNGPDQIIAGNGHSLGTGTRVPGGWRVSGNWPLASGCKAADWIVGGFKEQAPQGGSSDGVMLAMLLPAKEFAIKETWQAMGLRGTGSHHVSIHNVFVEDAFVSDLAKADHSIDSPLYRHPVHLSTLTYSAVHLGIAEAALADIIELHKAHPDSKHSSPRELAYFQLGTNNAKFLAAEAIFERQVVSNWSDAIEGGPPDYSKLTATIQMATYVAAETLEIVRSCFEMAGSVAVYENFPLQRRLRDIEVATQHGIVQRNNLMAGGKALLELG
jgi:indole-3-acetate monooxygenase